MHSVVGSGDALVDKTNMLCPQSLVGKSVKQRNTHTSFRMSVLYEKEINGVATESAQGLVQTSAQEMPSEELHLTGTGMTCWVSSAGSPKAWAMALYFSPSHGLALLQ